MPVSANMLCEVLKPNRLKGRMEGEGLTRAGEFMATTILSFSTTQYDSYNMLRQNVTGIIREIPTFIYEMNEGVLQSNTLYM
jgi:hypothetical protein